MKYICLGYNEPGTFEGMTEDEALRTEVGELRRLPPSSTVSRDDEAAAGGVEGPFVRAARWLERRLRGRG